MDVEEGEEEEEEGNEEELEQSLNSLFNYLYFPMGWRWMSLRRKRRSKGLERARHLGILRTFRMKRRR